MPKAIRQDIAWLYAQPEGRKLFDEAVAVHSKPVRFAYGETAPCTYTDIDGAHTITLNPAITQQHYYDVHETPQPFTMRQVIGHELAHAGQSGLANHGEEQLMKRIEQEAFRLMGENKEAFEEGVQVIEAASNAGSREEAKALLSKHLDKTYSPEAGENIISLMRQNHEYARLIDDFEAPAIQAENSILRLMGKPERHPDYLIHLKHQFATMKEQVLNMQLELLEADSGWKNVAEVAAAPPHAEVTPVENSVLDAVEQKAAKVERGFVDRLFRNTEGSLHKGKLAGAAAIALAGSWAAYEALKRDKAQDQENIR